MLFNAFVFADTNIIAIHNARPLSNNGYLVIQLMDLGGNGKICGFISDNPVKKGSIFSVNLNNISLYKKYLRNCTQEDVKTILKSTSPTYFVSVRYDKEGLITCNDYEGIYNNTMMIESYNVPFAQCRA